MGRGTFQKGYKGSVDEPVLAGDQPTEPIIAHLAMLIRKLAECGEMTEHREELASAAGRVEDFFRARWDAPEEPEG